MVTKDHTEVLTGVFASVRTDGYDCLAPLLGIKSYALCFISLSSACALSLLMPRYFQLFTVETGTPSEADASS